MLLIRTLLISLSILGASCGVGFATSDAGPQKNPTTVHNDQDAALRKTLKDARVAFDWQMWLLRELESHPNIYKQAWGVFSEGGWSNNGQTMIMQKVDGSIIMRVVHPGKKGPEAPVTLAPDQWKMLSAQINAAEKLSSIEKKVFDAIEYEFVVLGKRPQPTADGQWLVQKRIFLNALPSEETKPQNDLMMAFVNLRKEYQQKKP